LPGEDHTRQMRATGVRDALAYYADYRCGHNAILSAD
jgi:hypothetical protein